MPPPGRWRAARVGREPQELDGRATHLRTVDGDRVVSVLLKTCMESLTSMTARAALRLSAALAVLFADALTAVAVCVLERMDYTACRTKEHCAGHVVCMGSPKHTPFWQDSSYGMLNEDFSVRFSWFAQQIVTQLTQGDFAAVEQRLAGLIKPLFPVEALRASWQGIEQQAGALQEL